MTAVWILLAALLAVVLLGTVLFLIACRRGPVPDLTKPEVIAKWGRAEQTEEILAGVRLMQDAENIFLPSYDGLRLHGRLLQQPGAKGTILLFHGYRSSWVIDFSIVLPYYHSLGYDLLVVDERAHGQSEGDYITFGVRERRDVVTWAQYAAMHFGPTHPLILDGLSMGAATVLMAAGLDLPENVKGIIADCPYSSPRDIIRKVAKDMHMPDRLSWPFVKIGGRVYGGFDVDETDAARAVKQAKVPILIIHGESDSFVPCEMSDIVAENPTLVTRYTFPGADHGFSYLVDTPRYKKIVTEFAEKALAPKA